MIDKRGALNSNLLVGIVLVVAVAAALAAVLFKTGTRTVESGLSKEFEYDLDDLRAVDPALILYDETMAFETGLGLPSAVAVGPGNRIYVAGRDAVRVFEPDGRRVPGDIDLDGTPGGIALAADGTIYLGMTDHVEVYDPGGTRRAAWEPVSAETRITSIAVAEEDLVLADYGRREVIHCKRSGTIVGPIGDFVIPSPFFDVALGPDKTLHAANTGEHRIEVYSLDGNLVSWWGEFSNSAAGGFSGCCNPCNFALLPDNGGYATCEKGLTRVKIYDREGEFVGFVAEPAQFARHDARKEAPGFNWDLVGLDVAVDEQGRIVILDRTTAEIRIFEPKPAGASGPQSGETK